MFDCTYPLVPDAPAISKLISLYVAPRQAVTLPRYMQQDFMHSETVSTLVFYLLESGAGCDIRTTAPFATATAYSASAVTWLRRASVSVLDLTKSVAACSASAMTWWWRAAVSVSYLKAPATACSASAVTWWRRRPFPFRISRHQPVVSLYLCQLRIARVPI